MSFLRNAFDYFRWGNDLSGEGTETGYEDGVYSDDFEVTRDTPVIPIRQNRSEAGAMAIVRADPKNMDQATAVAEEIKARRPVLLNLQGATEPEGKRIRDFIGGVAFGLDGDMRKIADRVYICAPYDMPVEILLLDGTANGAARYESRERRAIPEI